MAGLRLSKNVKYKMLVTGTAWKKEVYSKRHNSQMHIHLVNLKDRDGGNYHCETWSKEPEQTAFIEGQTACFYLEFDGQNVDEIVALDCADLEGENDSADDQDVDEFNSPASSYEDSQLIALKTVAMNAAKDIFVARIAAGKYEGTLMDMSFLCNSASVIYKHLLKMGNE